MTQVKLRPCENSVQLEKNNYYWNYNLKRNSKNSRRQWWKSDINKRQRPFLRVFFTTLLYNVSLKFGKIKLCMINKVWCTVRSELHKLIKPFSMPKGDTALFFFFKLIFLSFTVPLLMDSVSALPSELWDASLSSEDLRFLVLSGLWLNDRRNTVEGSLLTRKKGPGSDELSLSSVLLRRKLEDRAAGAAAKEEPAFTLRFIVSLMCLTISLFSSAVLEGIIGNTVQNSVTPSDH